jgi:Tol biopolymer transport system component
MRCARGVALLMAALAACRAIPVPGTAREPELPPPVYTTADTAARFAPGLVSTGDVSGATVTRDGRTLYFTRADAGGTRSAIMRTRWTGSGWSTPERAPFSTGPRDRDPHLAPDGKGLYFTAPRRRDAEPGDRDGDDDTWSVRLGRADATPVRMASLANSVEHESTPTLTLDSTLYFALTPRAGGPSAIRYTHKKIRTTPVPVPLGADVVSPTSPFITADGRVLLFAAGGKGTRGGADLFLSVRREDGHFLPPRNLGREVNGDDRERLPALTQDGRHLFFTRERVDARGRVLSSDVYVVPVASVPVLRDALAR